MHKLNCWISVKSLRFINSISIQFKVIVVYQINLLTRARIFSPETLIERIIVLANVYRAVLKRFLVLVSQYSVVKLVTVQNLIHAALEVK